jgi:hypothetical protein
LIFGGSVILLEAAHQLSDTRKKIVQALEDIPSLLCQMQDTLNVYQYEEKMHLACAKLYVAVLQAYTYMVNWFRENPASE